MIRKISFKNFYSFKDNFEMSFLTTSRKTTFDYVESEVDNKKISKLGAVFGANGSGKTNVIRVFGFLQHFITRSTSDDEESPRKKSALAYKSFFSNKDQVEISVEIERYGKIFYYQVIIKDHVVHNEVLKVQAQNEEKHIVFTRKHNTLNLSKEYFDGISSDELPSIKDDASVIAFFHALPFDFEIMEDAYEAFSRPCWHVNINEIGRALLSIGFASMVYTQYAELFEEVENFVRNFDIGLQSFAISEDEEGSYVVRGVHGQYKLDFEYESRGTQALYALLAPILLAMRTDGLIVIDELETGLHPEAVSKLISYFLSESEEERCQFIFSTHSIDVMEKLDREQIFFVQKNNEGASEVYRLSQLKESRPDENFVKKYMSGKYGGFPKIRV